VNALPDALGRWRARLGVFDPAVAAALLPMLDRLARALGPVASDAEASSGDPAGYDGVAPRGAYERLLPSEWLLADELPDEFVRRAATREHLFYALAHERPRRRRATTVLVDAGPELFGTPRLGALAVLLVLAERAASSGAEFTWRLAQGEESFAAVGAPEIRALVDARAAFAIEAGTLPASDAASEVWVITGPRGAARAVGASVVQVADVIDPRERALAVDVRAAGRPARAITLPLPDDATCVRVLRDPFPHVAAPARSQVARAPLAVARPVISVGRASVFARLEDGALLVLPLPKSKRQDIGPGRVVRAMGCGDVVAAGHVQGKPAAILQRGEDVTLATWKSKGGGLVRRIGAARQGMRPAPLDGRIFPLGAVGERPVYVDRSGELLAFRPGNRAACLSSDACLGVVHTNRGLTFALEDDVDKTSLASGGPDVLDRWLVLWTGGRVHLGCDAQGAVLAAYWDLGKQQWRTLRVAPSHVARKPNAPEDLRYDPEAPRDGFVSASMELPASSEVVGVVARGASAPALVVLEAEGRKLRVVTSDGRRDTSIALPIVAAHAIVDAALQVAVCVSDGAELLFVSLEWNCILKRLSGDGDGGRG
jgi:hypothetical protein